MKKQHATTLQRRSAIVRAASGEKIQEPTEHSGDKSSKNKIIIGMVIGSCIVMAVCGVAWFFEPPECPVPEPYYQHQPLPEGVSAEEFLTNSKWIIDYEKHGFDCSQMSAYMEWRLENAGYDTVIMLDPTKQHAWIMVKIDDEWRAYETTSRRWIDDEPGSHDAKFLLADIYECWELSYGGEERFLREFGWWTHPPP